MPTLPIVSSSLMVSPVRKSTQKKCLPLTRQAQPYSLPSTSKAPLWQSSMSSRCHTDVADCEDGSIFNKVPPEACPQAIKTYPSWKTGVRAFCGDRGTNGADHTSAPVSTFTPTTDRCVRLINWRTSAWVTTTPEQ